MPNKCGRMSRLCLRSYTGSDRNQRNIYFHLEWAFTVRPLSSLTEMIEQEQITPYIDELRQTVSVASLNHDIWWSFKNRENRDLYANTMNRYASFFTTGINAHFVALLVPYRLYENKADTFNIPKLLASLRENVSFSAAIMIELDELMAQAAPLWKKVSILRNRAFGHRSRAQTTDEGRVPARSLIAFVKRDVSADDGCCLPPCFFVRQERTVFSSRPDVIKAARTVAVKQGRRPPAQPARSVLDRDEHGAIFEQMLGLASGGAVPITSVEPSGVTRSSVMRAGPHGSLRGRREDAARWRWGWMDRSGVRGPWWPQQGTRSHPRHASRRDASDADGSLLTC